MRITFVSFVYRSTTLIYGLEHLRRQASECTRRAAMFRGGKIPGTALDP
jgi:hypothetical protein